jgi:hypothetical protein
MGRGTRGEWTSEGGERIEAYTDPSGTQTVRVGPDVVSQLVLPPLDATHEFRVGSRAAVARYDASTGWTLRVDGVVVPQLLVKLDMGEVGGVFRRVAMLEPLARDGGRMLAEWTIDDQRVEAIVDATGTQTVRVGLRIVSRLPHGVDVVHAFSVGAHAVTVRYDVANRAWTLASDDAVIAPSVHAVAGSIRTLPRWSWPFVWGCMLMPLATLGGLVPMVIGFGCGAGCGAAARATKLSMAVRVTICAALLCVSWGTFGGLVWARRAAAAEADAPPMPAPSAAVENADRCDPKTRAMACDGTTLLLCLDGRVHPSRTCRMGCSEDAAHPGKVRCDQRVAELGDACDPKTFACSTDGGAALACINGRFAVQSKCSRGCEPLGKGDGIPDCR